MSEEPADDPAPIAPAAGDGAGVEAPSVEAIVEQSPEPEPAVLAPEPSFHPGDGAPVAAERPEVAIGGAFAGGFLLALILKRLAR